jgi:hypothetical protein
MEFLLLFALALGFWWYAGRVIGDVLDAADDAWTRARAWEETGRDRF